MERLHGTVAALLSQLGEAKVELAALADQLAVAEAKAAAAQLRTAAVEAELPSGMTRQERIEMARRMAPTAGRFRGAILAALNRSKGWELTEAEYYRLVDAPCHYCGGPTGSGIGLDRLHNGKGYSWTNVVPCCGPCNYQRGRTPYGEWKGLRP